MRSESVLFWKNPYLKNIIMNHAICLRKKYPKIWRISVQIISKTYCSAIIKIANSIITRMHTLIWPIWKTFAAKNCHTDFYIRTMMKFRNWLLTVGALYLCIHLKTIIWHVLCMNGGTVLSEMRDIIMHHEKEFSITLTMTMQVP